MMDNLLQAIARRSLVKCTWSISEAVRGAVTMSLLDHRIQSCYEEDLRRIELYRSATIATPKVWRTV